MAAVGSYIRACATALALCAVAACSTSSGERGESRPQDLEAGAVTLQALEPQQLAPGVCGMFLWARTPGEPVFIFTAMEREARVRVDGRLRTLPRTTADGASRHGHFETQTFSDGRLSIRVSTAFDEARRMVDGLGIERATIQVTDREGWETIIPAGGLLACGA